MTKRPDVTGAPGVSGGSVTVSAWTLVSRATGFLRAAAVAAVLGPTFFGNTYHVTTQIPQLVFEFLTGSLLASLLVPPLVRAIDRAQRPAGADQLAGSLMGVTLLGSGAVALIGVAAAPLILGIFASGVGDPAIAADQRRVGWVLMAMMMPQVVLYCVAGVAGAAQNAAGRFALPAAAQAVNNIATIGVLATVALVYGVGLDFDEAGSGVLVLLGLGTTGAVALQAALQCWGAHRAGVRLRPRAGWHDPDVRAVLERLRPSLGYAGLNAARIFAALAAANVVAGGVVAFGLALAFFYLPVAVGARPLAVAILPRLSRLAAQGRLAELRDESVRAAGMAFFLTVPAAVAFVTLADPLAGAAAFGEMGTSRGIELVSAALAALAAGIVGEAGFVVATHVSYSLDDAASPFKAMVLRTAISTVAIVASATMLDGAAALVGIGLGLSAGNLASAAFLADRLRRRLPPGGPSVWAPLGRSLGAALLMAGPAYGVAEAVGGAAPGQGAAILAVVAAATVGTVVFVACQRLWRSHELTALVAGLRRVRAGGA